MSRRRPALSESPAAACRGVLTFSPKPSTRILHSRSTPLSGTLFGILRGTTLHLHRTDPRTTSEDETADGTEVARIELVAQGFNSARRGKGTEILVERADVDGVVAATVGTTQQRNSVVKKRSSPGLMSTESTNVDKDLGKARIFAMRLGKRAKSISSVGAILLDDPSDDVEPLAFSATSKAEADQWVAAINSGITSSSFSTPSTAPLQSRKLVASASLPGGLATFANQRSATALSSRRPQTSQTILTAGLPAEFDAGRRPSFLDRPPPSPRNYVLPSVVTLTAASPPRKGARPHAPVSPVTLDGSDVPTWVQAVKHASPVETELRARRSMTLVDEQRNSISLMESNRADGTRGDSGTGGGRTGKLFSFLGSKRAKKEPSSASSDAPPRPSDQPTHHARHLSPPILYASTRQSNSSTSLSDSLSETHSTSASSDLRPLTPETTRDFSSSSTTHSLRSPSTLGNSISFPHSLSSISPHRKASSSQGSALAHHSRFPSSSNVGHNDSVFPWVDDPPVSQQQRDHWRANFGRRVPSSSENVNPRSSSESTRSDHRRHIIKPSELIWQMRSEGSDSSSSPLSTHRSNGGLLSSDGSPGGLSPTPRRVSSRTTSVGMTRTSSKQTVVCWPPSSPHAESVPASASAPEPQQTPRVIRRRPASFGGVDEII